MVYFTKPKDVSYTQMAIWIDENAYKEDCDDYLLFQYLYHIIGMLAFKRGFFNRNKYYNDFSVYGATALFLRLTNKKQFEYDTDGNPKLHRIKSILNYAKKKVYPLKVGFEQEHFAQTLSPEDVSPLAISTYGLYEPLHNDQFSRVDFVAYARDIPQTIKTYLYSKPSVMLSKNRYDIYISVLLTFLNATTLPAKTVRDLYKYADTLYKNPSTVERLYKKETRSPVILYNLRKGDRDFILVLYREIKELIAQDISNLYKSHQYGESVVKNMLANSLAEGNQDSR